MKYLFSILAWAVPALGVFIACTQRPKPPASLPLAPIAGVQKASPAAVPARFDPNEILAPFAMERPTWTVYYDFDSFALKEPNKVGLIADYLHVHPLARVFLAGHTSEEGTEEYNLALGARRAQTVRDYLAAAGIEENRINWISYGEEHPVAVDPEKWNLNRRCEIILEEVK